MLNQNIRTVTKLTKKTVRLLEMFKVNVSNTKPIISPEVKGSYLLHLLTFLTKRLDLSCLFTNNTAFCSR